MTNERMRHELDEKALEAATGGKPYHVFVPHLEKVRDMPDSTGGLAETGTCGGGVKELDDIELERVRGGVGEIHFDKDRSDRTADRGERAELPWV